MDCERSGQKMFVSISRPILPSGGVLYFSQTSPAVSAARGAGSARVARLSTRSR